ncbi:MAG: PTS sugar transporter subunit IIA [Desulfuromonadales bacterium]|nr:PTS sugar transporter subunit IIA [Desulfuromonadales bacterium]
MIGLVIAAHAGVARELLKAAEMIVGPLENSVAVEISPKDVADEIRSSFLEAINSVGSDKIIIMTDMFGGTPSNMSLSFLEENRIEVLTGVNLPMIIKFSSEREREDLTVLAREIMEAGRDGVAVAADYLR